MSYIRGGSDYAMIQSQAAMLKILHERDHSQRGLLKKALAILNRIAPMEKWAYGGEAEIDELIKSITEALKA
jgi:hypothetical protein